MIAETFRMKKKRFLLFLHVICHHLALRENHLLLVNQRQVASVHRVLEALVGASAPALEQRQAAGTGTVLAQVRVGLVVLEQLQNLLG